MCESFNILTPLAFRTTVYKIIIILTAKGGGRSVGDFALFPDERCGA